MSTEKYLPSDWRSLYMHQEIAEKLRRDPTAVLAIAYTNIDRWKATTSNGHSEWKTILDQGVERVLDVLLSETEEGQRLRSSSPFPGVLSPIERRRFFK